MSAPPTLDLQVKTFNTFVEGAGGDPATKNAVLLQATRTVFSPQVTGYVNSEKESDGSSSIVELARAALKSKN